MIGETVYVDGAPVENVLVEPGQHRGYDNIALPDGAYVDYTLLFPIEYQEAVHDATVTVRGVECETLNYADHWRPADVFGTWSGSWDMVVLVGRRLGDYTAAIEVRSLSAVVDALGDPVTTDSLVWAGNAQARMESGSEAAGDDEETLATETWHFVAPWTQAFGQLRPQSTYISYKGARYDVTSIENVDERSKTASFEAVRHG